MVEDAVSSEPVSAEFPVKQGKNREFSRNHPKICPIRPSNTLVSLVFWVEFPEHRNREYFHRNREFYPWNRELSGWIREPPYGPAPPWAMPFADTSVSSTRLMARRVGRSKLEGLARQSASRKAIIDVM